MDSGTESLADGRDRLPAGQFLTARFPVLTYGATPNVDSDEWEMKVWGAGLNTPIEFDWDGFNSLGEHQTTRDFHCVTTWSRYDNRWSGIGVRDFWQQIESQLSSKPAAIMFHCYGGYTTNLLLDDFLTEDNLFATEHDGAALSREHGGPMRFVCHHLYAWKSPKWVNGVELLNEEQRGFWEQNGYHNRGDPWAEERYAYQE